MPVSPALCRIHTIVLTLTLQKGSFQLSWQSQQPNKPERLDWSLNQTPTGLILSPARNTAMAWLGRYSVHGLPVPVTPL